jgi:hypothetical protein
MAELQMPVESQKLVAMKAESTAGADIFAGTYVTGDVLPVDYRTIRAVHDPNEIENLITMGSKGRAPSLKGPRLGRIDFRMPWRGSAAAAEYDDSPLVVPESHRVLLGCSLAPTFTNPGAGSSSVKYAPSDTDLTQTIYVVQPVPGGNAWSRQFVGCVGTVVLSGESGGPVFLDASYVGAWEEDADIAFTAGTLVNSPTYPQLVGALFQIGSGNYAAKVRSFRFSIGNRMVARRHINAATGVEGFKVVDRNPRLSLVCEVDRDANSTWWAAMRDGAPLKDVTFQLGSVHTNRLKFQFAGDGSSANVQVTTQQLDSAEDVAVFQVELLPTIVGGANSDWSLLAD